MLSQFANYLKEVRADNKLILVSAEHPTGLSALLNWIYYIKTPNLTEMLLIKDIWENTDLFKDFKGFSLTEVFQIWIESRFKDIKHRKSVVKKIKDICKLDVK